MIHLSRKNSVGPYYPPISENQNEWTKLLLSDVNPSGLHIICKRGRNAWKWSDSLCSRMTAYLHVMYALETFKVVRPYIVIFNSIFTSMVVPIHVFYWEKLFCSCLDWACADDSMFYKRACISHCHFITHLANSIDQSRINSELSQTRSHQQNLRWGMYQFPAMPRALAMRPL